MRNLVSIRTIKALDPIPGADQIHTATVDGWKVVVRKDENLAVGDQALYFEVDSLLPEDDPRFSFLEKTKFRVRTIKLRKQISQGVLLPLSTLTEDELHRMQTGEALTDILGVQKYEPPLPMSGEQKGTFPTHLVPKTDQERIQNTPEVLDGRSSMEFEITEKLDGTSCTIYSIVVRGLLFESMSPQEITEAQVENRRIVGVCSRNWEMKLDDENVYSKIIHDNDLVAKLTKLDRNIALQGEIIGPGIQGNKYKRGKQEFYVFDIYDIDQQQYVRAAERMQLCAMLNLKHVPVPAAFYLFAHIPGLQPWQQGDESCRLNLDTVLAAADGDSMLHKTPREGLVFKHLRENISFKAISNKFLLKAGE